MSVSYCQFPSSSKDPCALYLFCFAATYWLIISFWELDVQVQDHLFSMSLKFLCQGHRAGLRWATTDQHPWGRDPWKILGRGGDKWQSGGLIKEACDKWLGGLGGQMEKSKGPCPFIGELLVAPWTRQWLPRGWAKGWSPWFSLLGWVIWTRAEGLYQSSPAEKWMKIEFPKENWGAVIQTEINQRMPQRQGEQVSNSRRIIKETVSKCKW